MNKFYLLLNGKHHHLPLKAALLVLFFATIGAKSHAQSNPFQSMYFQNRYLANPAMAGIEPTLNINLGYQQQWNSFPGAPKTQSLTADDGLTDKVGVGLNVNNDQAGLIQTTRILGSYAYHVPLNGEGQKLSFGLSLGINSSSINNSKVNGDVSDDAVQQYNQLNLILMATWVLLIPIETGLQALPCKI
jgi:type IX secretion system PorP/SprF family membrane protein